MGMIEHYTAYAEAFEQAYGSDNWSMLEEDGCMASLLPLRALEEEFGRLMFDVEDV